MQHVSESFPERPGWHEEPGYCPEHGRYRAIYTRIAQRWVGGLCPLCLEAERERVQQQDRERQQALRVQAALRRSGIPERYLEASFEGFEAVTEQAQRVRERCHRYAATFRERFEVGTNLVLIGGAGTGKTHLACAIARHVMIEHRYQAIYSTVTNAVRQVRRTYDQDSEETEIQVIDRLAGVPLLVLDEVGVQSGSDHEHAVLFEVLDRRYADVRPTILVSNLTLEELGQVLGERALDRLLEEGAALTCEWPSYRRHLAMASGDKSGERAHRRGR